MSDQTQKKVTIFLNKSTYTIYTFGDINKEYMLFTYDLASIDGSIGLNAKVQKR